MSVTPPADPLALVGQVRALIADTDPTDPVLDTDLIIGHLTIERWDPLLAAALALETIAVSEVLVSKKIRTQDLQTDGPAVAAELRALAARYRARAAEIDGDDDAWDGFDIVGGVPTRPRPEHTGHEVWGL